MNTHCRPMLALLLSCALALPAAAANEAKPASNAPTPAKAKTAPATGKAADCPATAPAGSGGGVDSSQGAAVKGPVKPKCPADVKPKTQG